MRKELLVVRASDVKAASAPQLGILRVPSSSVSTIYASHCNGPSLSFHGWKAMRASTLGIGRWRENSQQRRRQVDPQPTPTLISALAGSSSAVIDRRWMHNDQAGQ